MHSSSALTHVSTIFQPTQAFGKLKESKLVVAASKVSAMRTDANNYIESIAIQGSGKYINDCVWGSDFIHNTMLTDFSDDKNETDAEKLKLRVKYMLQNAYAPAEQLELIDDLQRLGVSYHFDTEIKTILDRIYYQYYENGDLEWAETDLHTAALAFRLLRQHGYFVTQDIFNSFVDGDSGVFKMSLVEDVKGMLSLYEASYMSIEGESIMEEGLNFTTIHLRNLKNSEKLVADAYLNALLTHALELPLHWRTQRFEARWFIDIYPTKYDMNSCLLQFAKLDFNMVQGMYRNELQDLLRWWENLGLVKAMDFVRDSLEISYLWSASIYWEPEYEYTRKVFTQAVAILTTLDDVYDVNGALEELELFTNVVERWDVEAIERLPRHMRMCYTVLHNFINELANLSLDKNGFSSLPTLRNAWTTQVRSYLNESRWYHLGYQPTLEEYMSNARISVGVYSATVQAYIFDPKPVTEAELKYLESDPDILKWAAVIFRACNDLGASKEELERDTDNPKTVHCYMHENKASQEAAEKHVRDLVTQAWKKLNKIRYTEMSMPLTTIEKFVDTARASIIIYQFTNRNGMEDSVTKDLISKLLHDPISL